MSTDSEVASALPPGWIAEPRIAYPGTGNLWQLRITGEIIGHLRREPNGRWTSGVMWQSPVFPKTYTCAAYAVAAVIQALATRPVAPPR